MTTMATTEDSNTDAVAAVSQDASVSECIAEKDFASESPSNPPGGQIAGHPTADDASRDLTHDTSARSLLDATPQAHLVPDVLVPASVLASLASPSITGPSGSQPRKWLTVDGKLGAWQYESGSSRAKFVEKKSTSDLNDSNEETLLKAVRFGHTEIVAAILLEQKAGTEFVEEERGRTPLLCAAEGSSAVILQILLDNRAQWDATDDANRTALHLASSNGRDEIVQLLLQRTQIWIDEKDDQGEPIESGPVVPRTTYVC